MKTVIYCLIVVSNAAALFASPDSCLTLDFFCRAWLLEPEHDKLLHLSAFFLFTLVLLHCFAAHSGKLLPVLLLLCGVAEAVQIYIPEREVSWGDVYANFLGFLLGYALFAGSRLLRSGSRLS